MQVRSMVRLLLTALTLAVLWNGYSGWTSHASKPAPHTHACAGTP